MLVGSSTGRQGRVAALPAEANEFIGRAAELRRVAELLRANRLVTLVGPGGVGKTRIAIRAAERAAPGYPDGATFVQLSALRDPELLPHTVASRLGLPEQSPGTQLDAVLAHLRDRRLLLILDTCEHIIDAAALFAETVITETPNITILATTREPLNITAENCYAVPTLTLPNDDALPGDGDGDGENGDDGDASADAGPGSADAVELFALRAAAVAPGFTVNDANRAVIIDVCRRLDGLPLAIELAAARLKALPLAELAGRLEHRLPLLTGGRDGQDARHRTLRDAIGWSHDLCTQAEQTLWARLSVFAGSFGIDAAEEVCASSELPRGEIFETIIRLVDKSVLLREVSAKGDQAETDGPARLRMLDTIREFGAEQLAGAGAGAGAAIRNRHTARYLSMARYFRDHIVDDDQLARFRELRREHDNIRDALEYTLGAPPEQRERVQDGAEMATALYGYWMSAGLMLEGRYWLDRTLDRFTEPSTQRAWALAIRCYIGAVQGSLAQAIADGRESLRLAADLDDPLLRGRVYVYLCHPLVMGGQLDEAAEAGEQARRLLTPLGDRIGLITLELILIQVAQLSGDPEGAIAYYHRGLHLLDDPSGAGGAKSVGGSGELWMHGYLHVVAAFAFFQQPGREAECAKTLRLALLAKHELEEMTGTAYALELLGWLATRSGHHRRAAWLLGAADPLWRLVGTRLSATETLEGLRGQLVAASRDALGEQLFDSLFARGAHAPLDAMVALAITEAEEPGTALPLIPQPGMLTERERQVAFLAANGMRTDKIAESLYISRHAVEAHLEDVRAKLHISSVEQLTDWLSADQA